METRRVMQTVYGAENIKLGTCESEISVRIESAATVRIRINSRIESGIVVYMSIVDCHVGVVYVL